MDENYEITSETLREELEETLDWLQTEVMAAPRSVAITDGKKSGPSEFSQCVDAYEKLWKIYQAELNRDLDSDIKHTELDRKNCEYLESIAKRTAELKLKERELELREEESEFREKELDIKAEASQSESKARDRELEVKERDMYVRELTAKEGCRWWNKPIAQTALVCLTTLAVNGVAIYMNGSESPLKSIYEKWMVRPRL